MGESLVVSQNQKKIFSSNGRWLYPLFELETYCRKNGINPHRLFVKDTIAGLAAAGFMVYLGVRKCHIGVLSQKGLDFYKKNGVEVSWDELVPQISCKTEDLLSEDMTPKEIYDFLKKRAGLTGGIPLEVKDLYVSYGQHPVIKGLNLTLNAGESLIIKGSNGSGKTTLLKILLGLKKPENGIIRIDGDLLESSQWKKKRSLLGYVHQENIKNDFPISAREVVEIGLAGSRGKKAEADYRIEIAARRTGAYPLLDRLYHSLSGGEKQRVNLARCLCQNTELLLLDEPSSYLDVEGKAVLAELLEDMAKNLKLTIILVSHDSEWNERLGWKEEVLKEGILCSNC